MFSFFAAGSMICGAVMERLSESARAWPPVAKPGMDWTLRLSWPIVSPVLLL